MGRGRWKQNRYNPKWVKFLFGSYGFSNKTLTLPLEFLFIWAGFPGSSYLLRWHWKYNYCPSLGPSTIGQFSRQVNLLSQPLAASLILIWSCSNIVAFEIVDGSALKEMIFAYVFYKAIFSKAFYFCLCLRASLPFPTPKLRHFPCFFFPTHIFLHYPHTLPNLSIHSPELQTSGFCQWTALCIQYWFLSCTPPTW